MNNEEKMTMAGNDNKEDEQEKYSEKVFDKQDLALGNEDVEDLGLTRIFDNLSLEFDPKIIWIVKGILYSADNKKAVECFAACSLIHAYQLLFTDDGEFRPAVLKFLNKSSKSFTECKVLNSDKQTEIKPKLLRSYADLLVFEIANPNVIKKVVNRKTGNVLWEHISSFNLISHQLKEHFKNALNSVMGSEEKTKQSLNDIVKSFPELIKTYVLPFLKEEAKKPLPQDNMEDSFIKAVESINLSADQLTQLQTERYDSEVLGVKIDDSLPEEFSDIVQQSGIQLQAAFPEILEGAIDLYINLDKEADLSKINFSVVLFRVKNLLISLTSVQKDILSVPKDSIKKTYGQALYKEFLDCIEKLKNDPNNKQDTFIQQIVDNAVYGKFEADARVKLALDTGSSVFAIRALHTSFSGKTPGFRFFSRHVGQDRDAVSNDINPVHLINLLTGFVANESVVKIILNSDFYTNKILQMVRLAKNYDYRTWAEQVRKLAGAIKTIQDKFSNITIKPKLAKFIQKINDTPGLTKSQTTELSKTNKP